MELKSYQATVINDISRYLDLVQEKKDIRDAYTEFWRHHDRTPLEPTLGEAIEPYDNSVKGCPHVCVKVPTAGGKTFIACSSLKVIFSHYGNEKKKAVVWLVPSDAILKQTLKNLKDTFHPYRQKIDVDFSGKVEVFNKKELLNGAGLSVESLKQNLNIFVMSYDSFRTNNKDGRKVYEDNGNLQKFAPMLDVESLEEEISVMRILRELNPVVIVDESHNAKSELSIKMLNELNPSFVLDLTATPRANSNIISFVPAIELKKANMVKLPVIVSNQEDKHSVIDTAIHLQKQLEIKAKSAYESGTDSFIRPIVLFQAQPKKGEENTTYDKIKQILLKMKISEEQIKIKTADKDELTGIDLTSEDCKVRYIITVNALKEGWDCPFAYILASLADRTSTVDVEQILGRVLRLPYTRKHSVPELNLSYVLTSSTDFLNTLNQIVKGLNAAGFTEKDYKVANHVEYKIPEDYGTTLVKDPGLDFSSQNGDKAESLKTDPRNDLDVISENIEIQQKVNDVQNQQSSAVTTVDSITEEAKKQEAAFTQQAEQVFIQQKNGNIYIPPEMEKQVMKAEINDIYKESAKVVELPQFSIHANLGDLFGNNKDIPFDKEILLKDFKLSKENTEINFAAAKSQLYKVDLDETKKDTTPSFCRIDGKGTKEYLMRLLTDETKRPAKIASFSSVLLEIIGKMYPIPDSEIQKYMERVLEDFTDEQFADLASNEYSYASAVKNKIKQLSADYVRKEFNKQLKVNDIKADCRWTLPESKVLSKKGPAIQKSLYNREDDINGFEAEVINEIASMENVEWWTRNREKKDFCINGFINHYPDFIIKTAKGNVILLETKGDHMDAEAKIELGRLWEYKAGSNFKYCMVYGQRIVAGSYTKDEFLDLMKGM